LAVLMALTGSRRRPIFKVAVSVGARLKAIPADFATAAHFSFHGRRSRIAAKVGGQVAASLQKGNRMKFPSRDCHSGTAH
jgi:hypothetical protein